MFKRVNPYAHGLAEMEIKSAATASAALRPARKSPPSPEIPETEEWNRPTTENPPKSPTSSARPTRRLPRLPRRAAPPGNESPTRPIKDTQGDVEMSDPTQALVIYNPSVLKRTRDIYESTFHQRQQDAIRRDPDGEEARRKRRAFDKELPPPPSGSSPTKHKSPPRPAATGSNPRPAAAGSNLPAGPTATTSSAPRVKSHDHENSKLKKQADRSNPGQSKSKPPTGQPGSKPNAPNRKPHSTKNATKGKGVDKGKGVETEKSRASDFDDTDEDDSDTETIASIYANEPDNRDDQFSKILTLLERMCGKLDQVLTTQPEPEGHLNSGSNPSSSKAKPTKSRAARDKANLRPWDQTKVNTDFAGPQTREDTRKLIQGYIRTCFLTAFNVSSTKVGLPHGPPDDVIEPTMENFFIKWNESVHSQFNQAACDLIVGQLMANFPTLFDMDSYDQLIKMVKSHAKYLIRAYRWQQLPADDPTDLIRHMNSSANRRMHTTFNHRLHVVDTIPELNMHRDLLLRLGIDGTSSDEEDPDQPGVYRVKKIKQLSSSVRNLKQFLDDAFEVLEKGQKVKGSRSRKRVRTNDSTTRKFRIKGLPKNCLNKVWMARLSESQKSWYKFSDFEYIFRVPEEILKM